MSNRLVHSDYTRPFGINCTIGVWALSTFPLVNTIICVAGMIFKAISRFISEDQIEKSKFWTLIHELKVSEMAIFAIPILGNILALIHCCKAIKERENEDSILPSTHINARTNNPNYPNRYGVADHQVSWQTPFPEYAPPYFTHRSVIESENADPENQREIPDLASRASYIGFSSDPEGYPLNPVGRTGLKGRGNLHYWGPNFAADPVLTLFNPETKQLEIVVIWRREEQIWAIPGGMVEPGESPYQTAIREFGEEALNLHGEEINNNLTVKEIFKTGIPIYRGYSDDIRNTDNAWIETVALRYFVLPKLAKGLHFEAGDDAAQVKMIPIQYPMNLFASQDKIVKKVVEDLLKRQDIPHFSQVKKQLLDFMKAAIEAES